MSHAMPALMIASLLAAAATAAGAVRPDPAMGEWLTENGMAHVAVAPCPGDPAKACGAVTWLKDPIGHPSRDVNNPERALRSRPLVGVLVVRQMTSQGPGRWAGGEVYDPQSGKTYRGKLRAVSRNRMEVAGCILMVCDSETWTRVGD